MFSLAPIRIGVYYLMCLAVSLLLCCQFDTFAEYAGEIKPYSSLFTERIHKQLEDRNSTKIIYFGDSSLFAPVASESDPCDTPGLLSAILEREAPLKPIGIAMWSFLGANMYNYYCMFHKASLFSPDLLIIPINWNFLNKQGFPELCALAPLSNELSPDTENPIRSMGISWRRQLVYKVEILSLYPIGLRRWAREKLSPEFKEEEGDLSRRVRIGDKKYLRENYPLDISKTDQAYRFIRAVAALGSQHNIKILFYVSPLNQQYLERVGYFDREVFEASKRNIMEAAQGRGIYCMDLSGLLSDDDFQDTHEHYFPDARERIAEALAPKVIEILRETRQNQEKS